MIRVIFYAALSCFWSHSVLYCFTMAFRNLDPAVESHPFALSEVLEQLSVMSCSSVYGCRSERRCGGLCLHVAAIKQLCGEWAFDITAGYRRGLRLISGLLVCFLYYYGCTFGQYVFICVLISLCYHCHPDRLMFFRFYVGSDCAHGPVNKPHSHFTTKQYTTRCFWKHFTWEIGIPVT